MTEIFNRRGLKSLLDFYLTPEETIHEINKMNLFKKCLSIKGDLNVKYTQDDVIKFINEHPSIFNINNLYKVPNKDQHPEIYGL